MSDATELDVESFLKPVSEENPAGESLRWEPEYDQLEEARRADDTVEKEGIFQRDAKMADWALVLDLGGELLRDRSKDLQIAVWVAEALANLRGLAGLRDGFRLLKALLDTFWETAFPDLADLDIREGLFEYLDSDRRLPLFLAKVPLTAPTGLPQYSSLHHKESREVEEKIRKKPELEEEFQREGKVRADDFEKSYAASDREFYDGLIAELGQCQEALQALNATILSDGHFGSRGPALTRTMAALLDVSKLVGQLLKKKPAAAAPPVEPDPEVEEFEETEVAPEEGAAEAESSWGEPEPARPRARSRAAAARPSGGPIADPDDARARIADAARFLREADPTDPTAYLVVRGLALGGLYRAVSPLEPSHLPPPASEDRQNLRRLAAEAAWAEVLNETERLLARPEGAGWLDAQRYAVRALTELGHANAARGVEALLGAGLRDYPEWRRTELDDGTPCANSETRAWLDETHPAVAAPTPPAYVPSAPEPAPAPPSETDAEPDAWVRAQELLRDGQVQGAIALLARAARDSRTGRERFLRAHQQAELCLMLERPAIALSLLETLARQIEEMHLDQWEDPALCARVLAALYRCLKGQKQDDRARAVYQRLCQLDLGQALLVEDRAGE